MKYPKEYLNYTTCLLLSAGALQKLKFPPSCDIPVPGKTNKRQKVKEWGSVHPRVSSQKTTTEGMSWVGPHHEHSHFRAIPTFPRILPKI